MSDNVTPITQTHQCPSCHLEVAHAQRFNPEAHGEECKQPEIRMRRAELQLGQLTEIVHQLVGANNESVESIILFNKRLDRAENFLMPGGMKPVEDPNASTPSPDAEPSTQRSPLQVSCPCGDQERPGHPIGWCVTHTDPGAAKPPGEAPAGADPT